VVLGAGAMALAVIALCLSERSRPAFLGFSLGAGVLLMAFLQWVALIICGAILLAAIIVNLHNLVPS
jgi:predicted esterase